MEIIHKDIPARSANLVRDSPRRFRKSINAERNLSCTAESTLSDGLLGFDTHNQ